MEIDNFHVNVGKAKSELRPEKDLIHVRAIINCPKCGYKKTFKNRFRRKDMELMKTSLLVFDWLTCDKCGELLNLELEFKI
ncbi:MAG: hypothetical protein KGD63_11970 [Candidatus Lokiarchaeota archaeon]|nr:hypothetical protein [Candidatus Lokiarchaeota archaeon]